MPLSATAKRIDRAAIVYGQMAEGELRAQGYCDNCPGYAAWSFIRATMTFICVSCGRAFSDGKYHWLND